MDLFKGMDIYLIDQILKGRYSEGEKILDAGAGSGRNLNWFLANKFDLSACDQNPKSRDLIQARYLDVYPESKVDW
ncbi:MAG: tellurite methyltransferase, partial [Limisphaerales bacterium]